MIDNRFIFILIILLACLSISINAYTSTTNLNQVESHIAAANIALTSKNWNAALSEANKAEKLAKRNGAIFESIRVRAYFGKKDYARALRSYQRFLALSPSKKSASQIAYIKSQIDKQISKHKKRFANLAEKEKSIRQKEEKQRIARDKKAAQLEKIDVKKEAYKAGYVAHSWLGSTLHQSSRNDRWSHPRAGSETFGITSNRIIRYSVDGFDISANHTIGSVSCQSMFGNYYGSVQVYIDFYPRGDGLDVRYKNSIKSSPTRFGCSQYSIDGIDKYKRQIERFGKIFASDFIRNLSSNVKNVKFTDNMRLAIEKDRKVFFSVFFNVLNQKSPPTWEVYSLNLEKQKLEMAKTKEQKDYERFIEQGDDAFEKDEFSEAIKYYREATEIFPSKTYPKEKMAKAKEYIKVLEALNNTDDFIERLRKRLGEPKKDN